MSEPPRAAHSQLTHTVSGCPTKLHPETGVGPAGDPRPGDPVDYELLEMIGRGGMGVVYRARDRALNREVAVKILQERFSPASETASRFVEEARITGRLQHPGIPAVYQVGTLLDGRPFLAMKLIKGETLESLLKGEGPHPNRWLGAFEGVCHAVGYAHARNVIHRDLKPSNVMIGAFGEVQVMDWGLAKVVASVHAASAAATGEGETLAASVIPSPRDSDGTFTQTGSVLGTLAFMPPEQAAGELGKIDQRADVFGLGAILCTMLTGRPLYEGDSSDAIRIGAVRGRTEAAFARLDGCGADPEVVSLCKRCLAFEPTDRPPNADAVAREVARFREAADDRARAAELDRAKAEVQAAEQRKRKRVVQWAAGGLLAVMALGIAGTAWGLVRAERALGVAQQQRDDARAQRQHTRAAFDNLFTQEAINWLAAQGRVRPDQQTFIQTAAAHYEELARDEASDEAGGALVARARFRLGYLLLSLGRDGEAEAALRSAVDQWESLATRYPGAPEHRRQLGVSLTHLGNLLSRTGGPAAAESAFTRAVGALEAVSALSPSDPVPRADLARALNSRATHRQVPADADADFRRAVEIQEQLIALDRVNPNYHQDLAQTLTNLARVKLGRGDAAGARPAYTRAVEEFMSLAGRDPYEPAFRRDAGRALNGLGASLRATGEVEGSEGAFRKSIALHQQLVTDFPSVPAHRLDLAHTSTNLVSLLRDTGRAPATEAVLVQLAEVLRGPAQSPGDKASRLAHAATCLDLGRLTDDLGRSTVAAEWIGRALESLAALGAPLEPDTQLALRDTHRSAAVVFGKLGKPREAAGHWARTVGYCHPDQRHIWMPDWALAAVAAGDRAGALAVAEERAGMPPADPEVLFVLARVAAQCAGAAPEGPERNRSADRAAAWLSRAIADGLRDAARVRTHPDFAPIRSTTSFARVLADLDARPRPDKPKQEK